MWKGLSNKDPLSTLIFSIYIFLLSLRNKNQSSFQTWFSTFSLLISKSGVFKMIVLEFSEEITTKNFMIIIVFRIFIPAECNTSF